MGDQAHVFVVHLAKLIEFSGVAIIVGGIILAAVNFTRDGLRYLSRILRLTLLEPDIIEAILTGRQPTTLQLDELFKPLPAAWGRQRSILGILFCSRRSAARRRAQPLGSTRK